MLTEYYQKTKKGIKKGLQKVKFIRYLFSITV